MMIRDGDPRTAHSERGWRPLPLAAAAAAILALLFFGYNFGHEPSHSEKFGTVTPTEAEDGVTPSLSPNAGLDPSEASDASTERATAIPVSEP